MNLHGPSESLSNPPPVTAREYHIHAGKTEMGASLKKQFPGEEEAIDELMRLMKVYGQEMLDHMYCVFKVLNARFERHFHKGA